MVKNHSQLLVRCAPVSWTPCAWDPVRLQAGQLLAEVCIPTPLLGCHPQSCPCPCPCLHPQIESMRILPPHFQEVPVEVAPLPRDVPRQHYLLIPCLCTARRDSSGKAGYNGFKKFNQIYFGAQLQAEGHSSS